MNQVTKRPKVLKTRPAKADEVQPKVFPVRPHVLSRSVLVALAAVLLIGVVFVACQGGTSPTAPTAVAEASVASGAEAQKGTSTALATGGVSGLAPGPVEEQIQFNAHGQGQMGTINYADGFDQFFHGTVNCFEQMDANTVAFSGVIRETSFPTAEFFIAWVQDNGEPGNADRFRVSPQVAAPDCATDPWTIGGVPESEWRLVTTGNLQVH